MSAASDLIFEAGTFDHALELAKTLRPEDLAEVQACGFLDAVQALNLAIAGSKVSWACLVDGRVAAMFGVGDGPGGEQVWFLTGRLFLEHARLFVSRAKEVMRRLLEHHAQLQNHIDARYPAAVRWAKWLGFEVGEPVPYGPHGQLFHPAHIRRG